MALKEKLKKLEQRYHLVSDNMMDVIWLVDAETLNYEYVTPSIEKITGFTPEEYINSNMREMLSSESLTDGLKLLNYGKKRFIEQGISVIHKMEIQNVKKDGSLIWLEVRARLYREKDEPIKIVCVSRDINERKKAELRQNELIKKLEQTLVEKEKLLKENKILTGLLPICSGCKRIRDENGKWWPMDVYVTKKTNTELTHTMCQDCTDVYYGDLLVAYK